MTVKNKQALEQLIESIVEEEFLREDYDSLGIGADEYGAGGGGGNGAASISALRQTFVDPFTDIVKSAAYGVEAITAKAKGLAAQLGGGLIALLTPFLKVEPMMNYFKEKTDEKMSQIHSKYADVIERNKEALQGNDVWGLAFLLNPSLALGEKLIEKSPGAALNILEVLSGGSDVFKRIRTGIYGSGGEGKSLHEDANTDQALKDKLKAVVKDPKFRAQFMTSPAVQQMQADGINMVVERVKELAGAKTLEDLGKLIPPEQLQVLESHLQQEAQKLQATPQDIEIAKQEMLKQAMAEIKKSHILLLNSFVQTNPSLQGLVSKAVQQIQSL